MAQKDQLKWNKKYKETPALSEKKSVSKKLQNMITKIKGKDALDIACGTGRNSIYLATLNFNVIALDISEVALDVLDQKSYPNITTQHIDLDNFIPSSNSYDLIIMCNFLDRKLIPYLSNALKKDGILIIETFMKHSSNEKKESNTDYLLQKNELKSFFDSGVKILEYDEFDNDSNELFKMRKQSIIVRKN